MPGPPAPPTEQIPNQHMPEILVVEDDRKTADLVRLYLRHAGFDVRVAHDGEAALCQAQQQAADLYILDVMLPELDGLELCRTLRCVEPVPVIFLTARATETDRLRGLELGADDYVSKPFSPRELVARVKAVLRRVNGGDDDAAEIRDGDLVVDLARGEARLRGSRVHLTPKEFGLLRVLARARGRPFTRQSLVERAFGFDYGGLERTVDVHVANLRRKIEDDPARPCHVLTVQGVGYKFADAHSGAHAARD